MKKSKHRLTGVPMMIALAVGLAPWAGAAEYNDVASGNWNSTNTWSPNTGYPASGDTAVIDSHTVTANVSLTNSTAPTSITVSAGGTVAHADAVVVASPVTMSGGTWAQSGSGGAAARRLTGPVTVTSDSLLTARRGLQGIWLDGPVSGAGRMTFRAVDGYQGEYQSVYLTAASNTHSGGMVVESNSLSLVAVTNQSLGTGDITVNADGSLWFRQTQDYTGAPRTPIVTLATTSSVVGFQSVDGMTLPFDLVVQGGGKVTMQSDRVNELWSGAVTLNTNLTLAARRNNNVVGFALAGPVSGSGGIVVYADDSYQGDQGVVELRRGTNTYAGGTTIRYGRLKVSADGALGTGPVTVYNSQISDGNGTKGYRTALQLDATPDMNWSLSNSIAGDGTIWVEGGTGSYRLTSSGTVSPGTNSGAVAVLTVDGQFAFAKNGGTPVTLAIDAVNVGTTPGTDHDQLKVDHGDATLAASITNCALVLNRIPTPNQMNGLTLTILSAPGADFSSYQFASVTNLGSGGSVVYSNGSISLTWVAQTPVIQNSSYANLVATSCDVSGYLSSTGASPTVVRCYWGTNSAGTSGWGYTNDLGTQAIGTVWTSLTNLTSGVTYYYRFYATNGVGEYWSLATSNFTTLADVTWNDATNGNWIANNANTWGVGLNQYPQFPLNDTVFIDSHTVTVAGAQPAVKATWVTQTATATGTLYYADSSVQTRDLNLAGGVLQLESADNGGAKITNSVIRVASNTVVYTSGGGQFNNMDARIWSEIRDAAGGTGELTASGGSYVRLRLYAANTNFSGGWRATLGRGLHVQTEGALGVGTSTVDTAIEVMVDHTNTATRPPPARVICNAGGGVYLNNAFPGYDVTVKDWEIELRGGALGFGVDGVGTYRGGHVYVVSNSTFYGRRDERWGTDSRCEAEIVGTGRVTINANAGGIGTADSQPMRFFLSGANTNFSGGIDLRWNQLVAEQTNALGTGPILVASSDSGSGLYLDRPAGNFDWTLANDLSGGRGTNVAIKVEDGTGTNALTMLGTLDPGTNGAAVTTNSTGILRVDGSVAFGTGSRLRIHIAGTNGVAGVDYDQLRVDHDLTRLSNAVLEVRVNTNLFKNALVGQEFVVASNAAALVGSFVSVEWNMPWRGKVKVNDPAGTVKLVEVTAAPQPGTVLLVQ